eukprot:GFUD01032869.1.p1 GENE.GFUD01032869.1~~GFUD01032869.1.p1  ORF type:complete len:133 (-),score=16.13 GFUD01032869.1:15-413(-)
MMDDGVISVRREEHDGDGFASYCTPTDPDFLLAHSSVDGYRSWRNNVHGSCFIQVLGAVLSANASTRDLASMMTMVAKGVATEFETISSTNEWNGKKQMPFIYATLTAKVFFPTKQRLFYCFVGNVLRCIHM